VTFYQGPLVEVWQPNLETKLTFHDVSVKPAVPFFMPGGGALPDARGVLAVPYTIHDRQYEEGEIVLALWLYNENGSRYEVFPRRQFVNVKYPHTGAFDADGRFWVAGLKEWIYEDGPYGPEVKEGVSLDDAHTYIDVYELVSDPALPAYQQELRSRWEEQHAGWESQHVPAHELAPYTFKHALVRVATYPFPANCVWPLLTLTGDGHALAACYDTGALYVLRVGTPRGVLPPDQRGSAAASGHAAAPPLSIALAREHDDGVVQRRIDEPCGITKIGAVVMDPGGAAFILLDRGRNRIVSMRWPPTEADAAACAPDAVKSLPVDIKW
jgi:hypothetical protein